MVIDEEYAGHILIGDSVKADTRQAVSQLRSIGIERVEIPAATALRLRQLPIIYAWMRSM